MWLKVDETNSPFVSGVIKGKSNSTLLKDVRFNSRIVWEKKQHYYLLKYISLGKKKTSEK